MSPTADLSASLDQIAARIAELTIQRYGELKISQILSEEFKKDISRNMVSRYRSRDVYKQIMTAHREILVKEAVGHIKSELARLSTKVVSVIEHHLNENNLQVIPHAIKILGFENEAPQQQAQGITVIMPGAKPEKDVSES